MIRFKPAYVGIASLAMTVLSISTVQAGVIEYSNRSSWKEAALLATGRATPNFSEDFSGLTTDIAYNNGAVAVPGSFLTFDTFPGPPSDSGFFLDFAGDNDTLPAVVGSGAIAGGSGFDGTKITSSSYLMAFGFDFGSRPSSGAPNLVSTNSTTNGGLTSGYNPFSSGPGFYGFVYDTVGESFSTITWANTADTSAMIDNIEAYDFDSGPTAVPEPGSLVVIGTCCGLGWGLFRRRQQRAKLS